MVNGMIDDIVYFECPKSEQRDLPVEYAIA